MEHTYREEHRLLKISGEDCRNKEGLNSEMQLRETKRRKRRQAHRREVRNSHLN